MDVRNSLLRISGGLVPALIAMTVGGCSAVQWEHDYQSGLTRAAQLRRRALVQVHSNISTDCRKMEDVFADPEVQELVSKYFVPIRLDTVMHRSVVEKLGVQVVPTFFIIRPDMTISGSQAGAMDADKFRLFLIKHTYD